MGVCANAATVGVPARVTRRRWRAFRMETLPRTHARHWHKNKTCASLLCNLWEWDSNDLVTNPFRHLIMQERHITSTFFQTVKTGRTNRTRLNISTFSNSVSLRVLQVVKRVRTVCPFVCTASASKIPIKSGVHRWARHVPAKFG